MVDESTNTMNLNGQREDKINKIEETLRGELLPDEVKIHIRSYTVTWNAHIHFQTKVLKQLLNGEPILRAFFPVLCPYLLEEWDTWENLLYSYADRLPALASHDQIYVNDVYTLIRKHIELQMKRTNISSCTWDDVVADLKNNLKNHMKNTID